jgi:hypothetical protein
MNLYMYLGSYHYFQKIKQTVAVVLWLWLSYFVSVLPPQMSFSGSKNVMLHVEYSFK